eukprot:5384970-Karenia_brevis.AAC.1
MIATSMGKQLARKARSCAPSSRRSTTSSGRLPMKNGCQLWGVHSRSTQSINLGASAPCVPASCHRSFDQD